MISIAGVNKFSVQVFASVVTIVAGALLLPTSARTAPAADVVDPFSVAEDSLFMDEGGGQFSAPSPDSASSAPAPSEQPKAKAAKSKAKSKAKPVPTAAADADASSKSTEPAGKKARKPASAVDDESTPPDALADIDDPSAPSNSANPSPEMKDEAAKAPTSDAVLGGGEVNPEGGHTYRSESDSPAPTPKSRAKPSKVAKSGKPVAPGKGMFVTTKETCPMFREPATTSEQMTTVKASRKIWVEQVDAAWVRAFNRAGEPGYVSHDCVE